MIIQIIAVGLVAAVLAVILRQHKPEYALAVALVFGLGVMALVALQLGGVAQSIRSLIQSAGIAQEYWALVVKALCVAYLAEFASQICQDAGEGSIGKKIDLAARITLLAMATPLLISTVEKLMSVLP